MPSPTTLIKAAAAALTSILLAACAGDPIGPFAGGKLSAPQSDAPYSDWSQIQWVDTVFIETRPTDPYSVQTWVISMDDTLYLPTSLIAGDSADARTWVQNVLADPSVRVQINDAVYPMHAERIIDAEHHQRALSAFQTKYASELPEIDDHALNAWIFKLTPAGER